MEADSFIHKRFVYGIAQEAEKLQKKEGSQINPTGTVIDNADCQYVYSLFSLHTVLRYFGSFEYDLENRKEEDRKNLSFELDEKRRRNLPSQVAFHLRGYIGVFSEDSMVLEGKELEKMCELLGNWSNVNMTSGNEQDELGGFIAKCELKRIESINEFERKKGLSIDAVNSSVEKKLIALKNILMVATTIVDDIFNGFWNGYKEKLEVKEIIEHEYIDRAINEKMELFIKSRELEDKKLQEELKKIREDFDVLHENHKKMYARISKEISEICDSCEEIKEEIAKANLSISQRIFEFLVDLKMKWKHHDWQ